MKKLITILLLAMFTLTSYGQFSKWALNGEYGIHAVGDKSATSATYFNHFGLGLRYNLNPAVSIGINGGYDNIDLEFYNPLGDIEEDYSLYEAEVDYTRFNLELYLNTFHLLDFNDDKFTVLLHGGPGVSIINSNNNFTSGPLGTEYNQTVGNLKGGATALFKLTDRFALTLDYSVVGNINQDITLDGAWDNPPTGISSNVSNVSIGASWYFSKFKKKKDTPKEDKFIHGDWYFPPITEIYEIIQSDTTIINQSDTTIINNYYSDNHQIREFVFFEHDKFEIRDTELNAIYRVYVILTEDTVNNLIIKGWASPTSSSDQYNLELSADRSKEVFEYFLDMGVDKSRIRLEYYGKDKHLGIKNVHDAARRVEMLVISKD